MRVLLIEDDVTFANSLKEFMKRKHFHADIVTDGKSAEAHAAMGIYGLIIMNPMLCKRNAVAFIKKIRACCVAPILVMSQSTEANDRIAALNAGADFYLTKPFDNTEFLACVNALLRRPAIPQAEFVFGNTVLNPNAARFVCEDHEVTLTATEFQIARLLFMNAGNIVPKETIVAYVWGIDSAAMDNHTEVYMVMIRRKLASIQSNVKINCTSGLGYYLDIK